jgi:hypothetical protein
MWVYRRTFNKIFLWLQMIFSFETSSEHMSHYHIPVVIIPAKPFDPRQYSSSSLLRTILNTLLVEFYARPMEIVPGVSVPVPKPDHGGNCFDKNGVVWRKA